MQRSILLTLLLLMAIVNVWSAPVVMTVPATSNIFRAGTSDTTADTSSSGLGTYPVLYTGTFPSTPDPYLALYFPNMTGSVTYHAGSGYNNGADGLDTGASGTNTMVSTTINSTNGLSGISKSNTIMFLVGVFLGSGQPSNTMGAAANNYDNGNSLIDFHPVIGQTFFIGDGRTSTGQVQHFYVPTGASRLYLGFADGNSFSGAPSYYGDNGGSFDVSVDGSSPSSVPEPGTIGLVSAALIGLFFRLRKRA